MNASHGRYPTSVPAGYGARAGIGSRSKALPIVVASGLAMGVFGGLFVVRAGQVEESQTGEETAGVAQVADAGPMAGPGAGSGSGSGSTVEGSTGSVAGSVMADAGAKSAAMAVISFTVKPRRAHIFVNGTELEGTSTEVPLQDGSADIDVVIKSSGHRSHRKNYTVTGDQEIDVSLRKRDESTGPGSLLDIR